MAALFVDTLMALARPRRSIPILAVCLPMLVAQGLFFQTGPAGLALGVLMCAAFVAVAPFSWRVLFRGGVDVHVLWKGPVYLVLGGLPAVIGYLVPRWVDLGPTFLTVPIDLAIATTLFWVGGWGLGRDIELEAGLQRERHRVAELEKEAERARLLALRAHLDPHFLFNTLNAIAEWCREDGEVAERAVLQLSAILREVLGGINAGRATWPLTRELELARNVLELHRTRDPSWFTIDWDADDVDADVPPLLLLPVFENAVKHGPAKGHRGPIKVRVRGGDRVTVEVDNPGPFTGPRPGGEGLQAVRSRLELQFGDAASFAIAGVGERTRATVEWPCAS